MWCLVFPKITHIGKKCDKLKKILDYALRTLSNFQDFFLVKLQQVLSSLQKHVKVNDWVMCYFRVRFFKKIQDWIFKSERIQKLILCFFTRQINPRSPGSWCLKGTEESTLEVDSSVPLTCHDPRDLGLICLVKKRKICFQILADFKIQSWIFLKKRTLRCLRSTWRLFRGKSGLLLGTVTCTNMDFF